MIEKQKFLKIYLAIAFGFWWGIAILYIIAGSFMEQLFGRLTITCPISIFVFYLPSLAGLYTYYHFGGTAALKQIAAKLVPEKKELFWFPVLFALFILFALLMHVGSIYFHLGTPKITYSPEQMVEVALLNFIKEFGLIGGVFGWIGFLLPYLQGILKSQLKAALLTGAIFGLWVLPGYIIPSYGATTSYPLYVLQLMSFILFQSYIFNQTRGSIIFYLFSFWLAATGSHIQLYFFNANVQVMQILFFLGASIIMHLILLLRKKSVTLQVFPDFLQVDMRKTIAK